jgi:hypothetical protein
VIITVVLMTIAVAATLAAGVVGWRAEDRAWTETQRANALAVTVVTQREAIESLERRVRDLGLRNRILSVEVRGSDPTARTEVMSTALANPVQWSPEPWQVVGRA